MKTPSQIQVEEYPLWNILVDLLLVCLSLTTTPFIVKHGTIFQRGFFCNDDSIRYPFKSSTVNDGYLYGVSSGLPVVVITAVELWLVWGDEGRRRRKALVAGHAVPEWALRLLRRILLYGFGLGCQEFLINVGKFTVGRLRPHFLTICKPNVMCNASDPSAYIQDFVCTGEKNFDLFQSRLSFPSGHSAMSFYAGVFIVFYLERRIRWPQRTIAIKTAFQVLVISLSWFTSLSRIQDYKHHWGDVAVGSALGALVALFWVQCVLYVRPDEAQSSGTSETTFVFQTEAQPTKE